MTENERQSDEEVKTPVKKKPVKHTQITGGRWWRRLAFYILTVNGLLVSVYNNLRDKELYVIMFLVSSLLLSVKDAINDHFDDEVIDPSGHEWKGNLIILSCFVVIVELQNIAEYLWATKFFDQSRQAKLRRINRAAYDAALLVARKTDPYAADYSYDFNSDDEMNEDRALVYWPPRNEIIIVKSTIQLRRKHFKTCCKNLFNNEHYD